MRQSNWPEIIAVFAIRLNRLFTALNLASEVEMGSWWDQGQLRFEKAPGPILLTLTSMLCNRETKSSPPASQWALEQWKVVFKS